jgi:hypothetical protein
MGREKRTVAVRSNPLQGEGAKAEDNRSPETRMTATAY